MATILAIFHTDHAVHRGTQMQNSHTAFRFVSQARFCISIMKNLAIYKDFLEKPANNRDHHNRPALSAGKCVPRSSL